MKLLANKIFKIGFVLICGFGIYLNLVGVPNLLELISYFTMASNTVVLIVIILELLKIFKIYQVSDGFLRVLKGSAIIATLVTMLVYNFVLIPYLQNNDVNYQIFSLKDVLVHYVTPILIMLDYLIFDKKGKYRPTDLLPLIIYPVGYIIYVIIYVSLGGRFTLTGVASKFPYFFFNYETQGIPLTVLILFLLTSMFYGLGALLFSLDRFLKRNNKSINL